MRRLLPWALAALLALTLLPGLAAMEAIDWREARDAVVARESLDGRGLLHPTVAGEPFFEKPFAGYAPELLARLVLRRVAPGSTARTEVAVSRAVRVAIAAALALTVAVVGTRCFGARAGWLAACALASMLGLPLATRCDGSQLLATLCAWLGIGALLAARIGRSRGPDAYRAMGYLLLAAAGLTGGPLSALWPLLGFALYARLARRSEPVVALRPSLGVPLMLALLLPWYALMAAHHGAAFLVPVLGFPYAAEARGAWWSGPVLALSFTVVLCFPWSSLLGAALRDAASRLRRARSPLASGSAASEPELLAHLLVALVCAAALPVALYSGPPLTAALPVLPGVALLCGRFLDRVLDGDVHAGHLSGATRITAIMGATAALLMVALSTRLPEATMSLRLTGIALLVGSAAPLLADLRGARRLAAGLFALPVALGAPVVQARVLPELEHWLNTREAAEVMLRVAPPTASLVLPETPPPSLRLLLPRALVVSPGLTGLAACAARDGRVYLAFRPSRERDVARRLDAPLEILSRTPALVLARAPMAPPAPQSAPATTSDSGRR